MSSTQSSSDSTLVDHASTLPPELLVHILHCAQEGLTAPEQLQVRLTFESVCRSWFECEFRWKVVAVKGLDKAAKLLEVLSEMAPGASHGRTTRTSARTGGAKAAAEEITARIQTVHLAFIGFGTKDKVEKLSQLVRLFTKATQLEFVVDYDALVGAGDCLGPAVTKGLGAMARVEHFEIKGVGSGTRRPYISGGTMKGLPKWSQLSSLRFENCTVWASATPPRILRSPKLELAEFKDSCECSDKVQSVVCNLPPSVRALKLDLSGAFLQSRRTALINTSPHALERAAQLTKLTFTEFNRIYYLVGFEVAPRGQLEQFIAHCENLEQLTINPCAVKDLASLAKLAKLKQLTVHLGLAEPSEPVAMSEFAALLGQSSSLEQLAISLEIAHTFSIRERCILRDAAPEKVKLSWFGLNGHPLEGKFAEALYKDCFFDENSDE